MQRSLSFNIHARDTKTQAKTGEIKTAHGVIRTPGFVPVGSCATIKSLTPEEIKACHIDVFFVNTYHMLFRPGIDTIKQLGELHTFMQWNRSVMTDSGGFQAFSLGEFGPRTAIQRTGESLISIKDEGITFTSAWDGKKVFLGPKESIKAQQDLGSDIMMAFDECTFYPIKKERAQEAMERTHRWLDVCIEQRDAKNKCHPERSRGISTTQSSVEKIPPRASLGRDDNFSHALYGIVQGSVFEDLRIESAQHIAQLPVDGFAIGSVANSKEPREKVFAVLDWTMPILLPKEKPIHFLGIGEIEDILISVSKGVDTMDCITPTRMGRMGYIFTKEAGLKNKFRYDITKSEFSLDKNPPDIGCTCYTCSNYSRAYLNHLFRARELLSYRLATIHNLHFFGTLMESVREAIAEGKYREFKSSWLE